MIIINFREYFYLYESIDQNFDQWLVDLKTHARPDESEIKTFNIPDNKKQFIINTLKSKNIEDKQYMKYLIGFATTPQSSHIEDYDRVVDTLKWFIQTNRLTKAQVEADGWFNTGKRATELTREKDQILNPASKTKEKKEKKLGIAEDISPLFQSGNIKIYFSPKVTNEKSNFEKIKEDAEKPEMKARHKILCKYGKDTDWCTASPTGTSHVMYADRNIYIVHIDDKPAYQFMDCSEGDTDDRCQFHDAKNVSAILIPLDLALLIKEKLPKIASFYGCVINTFIENGDLDIVKYLVEKGGKVGFDTVSYAAGTGNLELVEYLIEKCGKIGDKAVYYAAEKGNLDFVKCLVKKGAKIGDETVSKAAESNRLDLVKFLVENGGKIGDEAVSSAAEKGNLDLVKFLVENGGKIGDDAVSKAARTDNLELVEYLVEKGAEIGDVAVYYAAEKGNLDFVKYLVKKGAEIGDDAVSSAAEKGNLDLVKFLVENGGKIGEYTVKHALAGSDNLALVKYLVDEKGAKISDDVVSYAIHNAVMTGSLDTIEYLLEKGAKIGKYDVYRAVEYGFDNGVDLVEYLIEKGGIIDDETVRLAAKNNDLKFVKYLVEKGAEIGDAVSYAADNDNLDIVEYLVKKGGKVDNYAVRYAANNGNLDLVNYLKSAMNRN